MRCIRTLEQIEADIAATNNELTKHYRELAEYVASPNITNCIAHKKSEIHSNIDFLDRILTTLHHELNIAKTQSPQTQ